jgi:hypothetical protein
VQKALGEPVTYNDVDPDVYRSFGFPRADELGNMSGYTDDAVIRVGNFGPGISFIQKLFTGGALARRVRELLDLPAA